VAIKDQRLYLHANAVLGMAPGSGQTLYVLTREEAVGVGTRPARILRLDYSSNPPTQSTYALLPDLPRCLSATTATCSPTLLDLEPVPNSIAFDLDGFAYITDTGQAVIWRVHPGGGTAEVWFTDRRLDAIVTGPNGATLDTAARRFYFTTSPSPIEGVVWWLPLVPTPAPDDLRRFHTFEEVPAVPDGLALGEKGVYVALASGQAVVILDAMGNESARIVLGQRLQLNRYGIVTPASMAFDGAGRVLVANVDFNNPLGFGSAIFDVWVDDPGIPLVRA
jgi:sugar lactone lactonase YvrE